MATGEAKKGHPRGLYVLFATEMWERFSYYGMRALLVLYLVDYLRWAPSQASGVYKWYTSLVYLTPLLGGFLADKYLGQRVAIIIGGVLMAIGHFLMAFEPLPFFYAALVFLIFGNGFFKPNISTMVGQMYRPDDARRDGAFSIFYMGINLGAFFSPLVCGWLAAKFTPHWGFGAAGVGMVIGLAVFILGQKTVMADIDAAKDGTFPERAAGASQKNAKVAPPAEEPIEREPTVSGFAGGVAKFLPPFMLVCCALIPAWYIFQIATGHAKVLDAVMPIAFAAISGWMGATLFKIKGAGRDRSSVIFYLFFFTVFFWMAFEQAGNALNIWAEYNTDLHVGSYAYPAAWFQSVNPLFIIVLGPVFSIMWIALESRGKGIPTPAKMFIGLGFIAASFGAMVAGAVAENATESRIALAELPSGAEISKVHAGRLTYDAGTHELVVRGTLPPFAQFDALKLTVPEAYAKSIADLEDAAGNASKAKPVTAKLEALPPGYTFPLEPSSKGNEKITAWDAGTQTVTLTGGLSPEQRTVLVGAGAPSAWRDALTGLAAVSQKARVSGMWLFISYLLATIAELFISPVGLSMVTKLAPARYGSLFMGVWLLSSSVAQYTGGALGEMWGHVTPTSYFSIFVYTSLAGCLVLGLLMKPLDRMMHGVK